MVNELWNNSEYIVEHKNRQLNGMDTDGIYYRCFRPSNEKKMQKEEKYRITDEWLMNDNVQPIEFESEYYYDISFFLLFLSIVYPPKPYKVRPCLLSA